MTVGYLLRTVKLCDPLESGDYKLHLESGGQKETQTISVCVVGKRDVLCVCVCVWCFFKVFFIN